MNTSWNIERPLPKTIHDGSQRLQRQADTLLLKAPLETGNSFELTAEQKARNEKIRGTDRAELRRVTNLVRAERQRRATARTNGLT